MTIVSPGESTAIGGKTAAYRAAGRTIALAMVFSLSVLSVHCRNFGDFWNKKAADGSTVGLLPNQVAPPTFAPAAGIYNTTQNVSMSSATGGATICYTTDGVTTPVCDATTATCLTGNTYGVTIAVTADQTLTALACVAGMINSPISSAAYVIDTTAPVISGVSPAGGTYITNTQVSYTLSENCSTGSVTWAQTGGNPDPGSPRVQALVGAELSAGTKTNITLTNNPALVDGATYSVKFDCTDAAGNAATPVTVTNVTYDAAVPVISAVAPTAGAFVNNTNVSYTLSENCQSGSVTWTRTGGSADVLSPHVKALVGAELTAGAHNNITLTNAPTLVSGAIYTLSFDCTDFAARSAATVNVASVTFDNTAPVISGVTPLDSTFVNTAAVSYSLNETCATASITWTRTGGSFDGASPHVKALVGGELSAGVKTNILITNNPTLVDGAIYSLDFNCTDAAGNTAAPITRTNVTFDPSAVVISAVTPTTGSFRNTTQVSYTLSENCASGTVTWTRTGGNPDPGSPRIQTLTGSELTAGTKSNITLANNPTLVDGAVYSVQFDCTDFAANPSTPITVTNVTYDFTAPLISGVAPTSSAFVKDTMVSFTFSENCANASITWTQTGGVADGSSPHVQALTGPELNAGAHNGLFITNNPTLVSGAIYMLEFNCTDAAGNAAGTVPMTNVTFDNTPPTVSIQNLREKSTVHTGTVIGPATDNVGVTQVQFNLDSTTWNNATYVAPNWKFALPMGASTWRDRSAHTIQVRAVDAAGNITTTPIINVRKGNNRDVNGDGYEDVAVTGHKHDTTQGAIYVYYGMAGGLPDDPIGITPTVESSTANDFFGRNSTMADFNGDGFADVAIAAPGTGVLMTGRAFVHHGSPAGLNSSATTTLNGISNQDLFGTTIIAGDLDNDGYADLVIGAMGYNANTQVGRVYLYRSTGTAISNTVWKTITGEGSAHQFGSSLAIGDFNQDTLTDLAVAAQRYNNGTNDGRVYVFNSVQVLGANTTATPSDALTTGTAGEYMGTSIATGDVNGDGASDLIIGAVYHGSNAGRVYVHYGATGTGLSPTPSGLLTGTSTPGYFGTFVFSRDMNNDGYDDIISGAHGNGVNVGAAYIVYGQAANLGSLMTNAGGVYSIIGENSTSFFGRGGNATDLNGDGYPDLIVGAPIFNASRGRAYVVFGTAAGPLETNAAASAITALDGQSAQTAEFATSLNR